MIRFKTSWDKQRMQTEVRIRPTLIGWAWEISYRKPSVSYWTRDRARDGWVLTLHGAMRVSQRKAAATVAEVMGS